MVKLRLLGWHLRGKGEVKGLSCCICFELRVGEGIEGNEVNRGNQPNEHMTTQKTMGLISIENKQSRTET